MNVNFFEWLRDGVRRSVLLGVGDAMEQIGTPADNDEAHPALAALFETQQIDSQQSKGKRGKKASTRKRLGKTLKDLDPMPKKD